MDQRVESVIALMRRRLHRKLSLNELAKSVHLSSSRLRHLFKSETGVSPSHYFRRVKWERAKELLETTELSVPEIIIRVGMHDRSHFEREFKKKHELTPTRYRTTVRSVTSEM